MAGLVGKSSTKPSSTWEINLGEIGFQTNKIWGFPHNLHNQPPRPPTWWPLTVARACAAPLGMAGSAQLWKFRNGNGLNMWVLHGFTSNKWGFRFISPAINGDSYETMGDLNRQWMSLCPVIKNWLWSEQSVDAGTQHVPAKARKKLGFDMSTLSNLIQSVALWGFFICWASGADHSLSLRSSEGGR